MSTTTGRLNCPPFIQDELQHRKAIAQWMTQVAPFINSTVFPFVSVTDAPFNAKGDGVTDDTAAIQAAIDSIPATGGEVYIPRGQYKITSTIFLPLWTYNLRLYGSGYGSSLNMSGATSFDLISAPNEGYNWATIEHLRLNGGALPGTGNLMYIVTGTTMIRNIFLLAIPLGGSGIYVNGITTQNHEVCLSQLFIDNTSGFAGINWGDKAADSAMTSIEMKGLGGISYPVYFAAGSAAIRVSDIHLYGGLITGSISINNPSSAIWFTDCFFDSGFGGSTIICTNMSYAHFSNCTLGYGPAGTSSIELNNSTYNTFTNCTLIGNGTEKAILETGISNHNTFNTYTLHGVYTAAQPITLVGYSSRAAPSGASTELAATYALPSNTTAYIGGGSANADMDGISEANARWLIPGISYTRTLTLVSSVAPGAAQTFIATVFINGIATALTCTISGAATTSASAIARIDIPHSLSNALSIRIVSSAGTAAATLYANVILDR